jgi:large subunit ribosomal protein L15
MQLHDARKADLGRHRRMRVGRGTASGKGKTSGRGLKGATARSGYSMKVTYEGGQMPFFRRLPKRGFNNARFAVRYAEINVGVLARFPSGSTVDRETLLKAGLLRGCERLPIKILGDGELSVSLTIKVEAFSKSAQTKIAAAGGQVAWLHGEPKKKAPNFVRLAKEKAMADAKVAAKAEAEKAAKEGKKPSVAKKGDKGDKSDKSAKVEKARGDKAASKGAGTEKKEA